MAKLTDLANQFFALRIEKENIAGTLKEVQQKLDSTENELLEELAHEGLSRLDLRGKGSFFISSRKFFKISDKDAFINFIHEQGDTDLLSVQHNTLNAYSKEMYARKNSEGIDDFEIPGVVFTEKTSIKMKKIGGSENESDNNSDSED